MLMGNALPITYYLLVMGNALPISENYQLNLSFPILLV